MKAWLRILPIAILFFAVLVYLDFVSQPDNIRWLLHLGQALGLTAIGCVGQYMIHKNILKSEDEDDSDGCINCGKP